MEKIDDWQKKNINELLKEALRVYLRREEEKAKTKARIMVAVARESAGIDKPTLPLKPNRDTQLVCQRKGLHQPKSPGPIPDNRKCFCCGEVGHIKKNCKRFELDEAIAREQDTLEKILKGDD